MYRKVANKTRLLHRNLRNVMPKAVQGSGYYIVDDSGRRYLDASGGAAVSCLGHGHPAVAEAMKNQIDRLAYAHTSFFTTEPAEELAEILTEGTNGKLTRAFFVSGGSEAVEAAIKLARQYHVERHQPQRYHIISRRQSYHGNTIGALSVSGHRKRREAYEPYLFATTQISPCYPYRDRSLNETEESYGQRIAGELEDTILNHPPDSVAAFIAETVSGATLGAQPAVPGYFRRIREICDQYGILLILDEVMSGMGRTGTLFAFEQEEIAPDIVCCAKGLGGGYQSIGAVLTAEKVVEALTDGTGILAHGHTYMAHPIACAAAVAVQHVISREGLLANVKSQGEVLANALHSRFQSHPHVGDVRGRGLFYGLELVQDRKSKLPFDAGLKISDRIKAAAFDLGMICYPSSGTCDGVRGDHVLLAPPYNIDGQGVALIVDLLNETFSRVFGTTRPT
jgi:adenosylmethionine-8-amino-7-oxononanoate aminotransferase